MSQLVIPYLEHAKLILDDPDNYTLSGEPKKSLKEVRLEIETQLENFISNLDFKLEQYQYEGLVWRVGRKEQHKTADKMADIVNLDIIHHKDIKEGEGRIKLDLECQDIHTWSTITLCGYEINQ